MERDEFCSPLDRARFIERLLKEIGIQIQKDIPIPADVPRRLADLLRELEKRG
jgi:hypothetical protein